MTTPTPESPALRAGAFYVATNSDQSPGGEFAFTLSTSPLEHHAHVNVWGFSVYRREPGYRTLGVRLDEWLARPGNAGIVIREDCDRRQSPALQRLRDAAEPKPEPTNPDRAQVAVLGTPDSITVTVRRPEPASAHFAD